MKKVPAIGIIMFFLLFPTYMPTYLYQFLGLVSLVSLIRYGILIFCFFSLLYKKKNISLTGWLVILSYVLVCISTYLSPTGEFDTYIRITIRGLSLVLLFEWGMKRNARVFLQTSLLMLEIIIYLNFITVILFPNGLYNAGAYSTNYLMGYHNTFIRWQIPALAISCILSFMKKKRISVRTWLLYMCVLLTNLLVKSSTGIIGAIIFGIGMFLTNGKKMKKSNRLNKKIFTIETMIVTSILGSIVVIGTIWGAMSFRILQIVLDFFGKNSTMSGRFYIWTSSIELIIKNFIWGYGYESADIISMKYVGKVGFATSAHNFWLELLYQGGVVLLTVVLIIFLVIRSKINKLTVNSISCIIGLWFITIGVMGITEPQYGNYLIIAWIICGNIDQLFKRDKKDKDKEL
ncbi:O-antigen ligase family protein [Clostridium perfringens]|uniref:O-antigen ligase family protein n=1 Tax=Clostridium perfringens TaxID=1502 RepID=UPI0030D4EE8B